MESELIQYGLAGIGLLAFSGVIVYQNKKLESLYKEKDELQEKRRLDVMEINDKYNAAMGNFSQMADLLLGKLKGGS